MQVWKIRTGQCLRKYERAHTQGVTSVSFSRDGTHVLSSSYDGLIRVHGIKSGKMLKELRGHTSYVNDAVYSPDGSQVGFHYYLLGILQAHPSNSIYAGLLPIVSASCAQACINVCCCTVRKVP